VRVFSKLMAAHFKQFVREKAAIFWTFAFPIFFILIFGAVFGGMDETIFPVGLVVEDDSAVAGQLNATFQNVSAFELHVGQRDDELEALKNGDRRAVIVVNEGFGDSVAQGKQADIDLYYDPTQTTSQQVVLPIIYQVVDGFDRAMAQAPSMIQVNEETLQAQDLRAIDYLVPGILAMAIMQLGIFAAAEIVSDRENRVLKRLGATPLRRSTMILSTIAFRLIVALCQAAIIILVARLAFDVPMLGNWAFLLGMVILGTLTFLAMGYMLSAFAKTERTAIPLLMSIQFPMMFLSGIFFPTEMMPGFMRPIMDAMPLTYLGDALRQIMVESSPLHSQLVNFGVLAGWLLVCIVVAIRFFKWE